MAKFLILTLALCAAASANPILSTLGGGGGGLGSLVGGLTQLPAGLLNNGGLGAITNSLPLLGRQRRMLGSLGLGNIGNLVSDLPTSMLNTGMQTAQGALKAVTGLTNNLPLLNRQRRMLGSLGLGGIGNMVGGLTELPASMLNTGMNTAQGALKAVSGITNNLPLLNRQRRMLGSLGLGQIGNMVGGLTELPASMLNTGMQTAQGALKAVTGITNNLPLLNRQRRMLGSLGLGSIGNMVGGLTELPANMIQTGMNTAQGALKGGLGVVSGITGLVQPANLLGGLSG